MARVIGIISIKGGVGKTSCTTNLGSALAMEFKQNVLIVDANFSAPNLALHIGLVDPEATLHDVLTNTCAPEKAIYEVHKNLHIMPGALIYAKVNPFKLGEKINKLREHYDIILIDSSPNLNNEILATMTASDELFVVTSPDFPTLSCTMNAIQVAKKNKTPITGLILNRVRNKSFELGVDEIEESTGVPVLAFIPEDIKIPESLAATQPATTYSPYTNATIEFKKLAGAILEKDFKDPRILPKLKRLFSTTPQKHEINRALLREGKLY